MRLLGMSARASGTRSSRKLIVSAGPGGLPGVPDDAAGPFVLNKLLPGTCKLAEIHQNNLVGAAGFMAGLFVAEALAVSVLISTALASTSQ